jgi:hypothetical protein
MKTILLAISLVVIAAGYLSGQVTDQEADLLDRDQELEEGWNTGGSFSLGVSQISLSNWAAGGESSLSGNGLVNFFAGYRRNNLLWTNILDIGYGIQRREGAPTRKTDDRIDAVSKLGIEAASNLYYAGLLNFRTQMAPGYADPENDVEISNFLSPGYLLGALGIDYRPVDNFSIFLAPVTSKITIVRSQALADAGAYGVEPGENFRNEFGSYFRADYRLNITDDIRLQTKLDLFSNYLDKPQNLDVNWETLLTMSLTDYIGISFSTHLIYDEDMVAGVDPDNGPPGPRVQFKQLLIVGFSYNF